MRRAEEPPGFLDRGAWDSKGDLALQAHTRVTNEPAGAVRVKLDEIVGA